MRTIEREVVAAVIFSKDGRLLQALQNPNGRGVYAGCWGILGGGVDEGEDHRTALNREIKEEAHIDISKYPAELIDTSTGSGEKTLRGTNERVLCNMNFYVYKVVIDDMDASDIWVILDNEHTEYRWSELSELKDLKLTPPSIELFTKLGSSGSKNRT